MEGLSNSQQIAVADVLELLQNVNVQLETFANLPQQTIQNTVNVLQEHASKLQPSLAIQKALYKLPKAVYFTEEQRLWQAHCVTRKSFVSALIDHPEGAIVEYPEAGENMGEAIAHRYTIDPIKYIDLKSNI